MITYGIDNINFNIKDNLVYTAHKYLNEVLQKIKIQN